MKKKIGKVTIILCMFLLLCGMKQEETQTDYSTKENWAILPEEISKDTDVFLIAPTVYYGDESHFNMELNDEKQRERIVGALNMETGIYEESGNIYSPYYRQSSLSYITLSEEEKKLYEEIAYTDIKTSFDYYMKHYNEGRPIVLAGFSQGGDMVLNLLRDYFKEDSYQQQLVCAYAIGVAVTDEYLAECPWLKMAKGEGDTGCIISFNSEAEDVETSFVVPETTNGINPLNWMTDSTPAEASSNLGACFMDYDGSIKEEVKEFCGGYLDEERGTLKIAGLNTEDYYNPKLSFIEPGVYHLFDYQFFYRNLQKNVTVRTEQYRLLQELENAKDAKQQEAAEAQENQEVQSTVKTPELTGMAVNVTKEMQTAEYWLEKCENPDEILMTADEIDALNSKRFGEPTTLNYAGYCSADGARSIGKKDLRKLLKSYKVPEKDFFLDGEKIDDAYWKALLDKRNLKAVEEKNPVQYGFSTARGSLRSLPTLDELFEDEEDTLFDELQSSSILLNEPLVVLHSSQDGNWKFIMTNYAYGWVLSSNIGICDSYDTWQQLQKEPFAVITESKYFLDMDTSNLAVSELELTMGTKLPLASDEEVLETHDGRVPYSCYAVRIPISEKDGSLAFETAFIPASCSVSLGYLDYTQRNVLQLAFASLGERYGWGGMFQARDCSQYIMEIYRCFGFQPGRNTGEQINMPMQTLYLGGMTEEEKTGILDFVPAGTPLYFPGHTMLYLGEENGNYYIISAVGSMNPEGTKDGAIKNIHTVTVNDLSVMRRNGNTWLQSLNIVKIFLPELTNRVKE